jgi:hypothetical protein
LEETCGKAPEWRTQGNQIRQPPASCSGRWAGPTLTALPRLGWHAQPGIIPADLIQELGPILGVAFLQGLGEHGFFGVTHGTAQVCRSPGRRRCPARTGSASLHYSMRHRRAKPIKKHKSTVCGPWSAQEQRRRGWCMNEWPRLSREVLNGRPTDRVDSRQASTEACRSNFAIGLVAHSIPGGRLEVKGHPLTRICVRLSASA